MEKANETWTNDLCPIESGENTDDAQVSFSIFSDISRNPELPILHCNLRIPGWLFLFG